MIFTKPLLFVQRPVFHSICTCRYIHIVDTVMLDNTPAWQIAASPAPIPALSVTLNLLLVSSLGCWL